MDRENAAASSGAHEGIAPSNLDVPDEIDRAFAHLTQLPAPRDLTANVLLAARAYRPGRRQIAWAVAETCAIVALAVLAFLAGQALVSAGTFDLAAALLADTEVFRAMPADSALALVDTLPWIELAGLVIAVVCVVLCTRAFARALSETAGWSRASTPGARG